MAKVVSRIKPESSYLWNNGESSLRIFKRLSNTLLVEGLMVLSQKSSSLLQQTIRGVRAGICTLPYLTSIMRDSERKECLNTIVSAPLAWYRGAEHRRPNKGDVITRFVLGFEKQTTITRASHLLEPCQIFPIRASRELAELIVDTRFLVLGGKSWSFGLLPKLVRRRPDNMENYLIVQRDELGVLYLRTHMIRSWILEQIPHKPRPHKRALEPSLSSSDEESVTPSPPVPSSSSSENSDAPAPPVPSLSSSEACVASEPQVSLSSSPEKCFV
uniref:Uncharacterized protein n=1 Tax=Timema douglasi TaxID=61478 RepID=A0A7R8ZC67_TIMDO|nr:unnamed protein product [Timema douglasi]